MAYVLTLLLALTIAVLTLTPTVPGPEGLPGLDKLAHALAFGLFVLPLSIAYPARWFRIWGLALAFGGLIEIVQPFVGRSNEWADLLADGVGAACGIGLVLLYFRARRLQKRRA
jgi:VanZ family protein